ncbi:MAG: M28 family peptidase, partial [Armatimonadota bacterium]
MYPELDAILRVHLSGRRAQECTESITQYYRSPGSSGYHAATGLVAEAIRHAGADEITEERYPLDGETRFMGRTMPPAWEPIEAVLEVVAPVSERLITYADIPSTLAWWCASTPDDGIVVRVIDVGRGLSSADYAGKDVRGNAVLIRDSESRPAWAHAAELARQHGAVGIITDFLHSQTPPWRTRKALPAAVQLLRLPPRWENPWAFSVGYGTAERLSALARSDPVTVRAVVRAKTFKGEGVNLIATIRGAERPDESVFFIAHTSAGTKPCANCAAGPALMVELCRAIQTAIRAGELPRPRRSIRFLFVAEGLGSTHFIHTHRDALAKIKAAICLDSVGHRQADLMSSLVLYRSPDSIPSYINDLGAALIEELPKEADWPFRSGPVIPLVNFQELPYTPWSDNHYWVTFGVPAPLCMSWPDRFFHTQLLTADHTDPMVFERSGRVLGSLALGIARAGAAEAGAIIQEVAAKAALRVSRVVRDALVAGESRGGHTLARVRQHVQFIVARDTQAVQSALDLADGDAGIAGSKVMA